jgi:hypothetical protein
MQKLSQEEKDLAILSEKGKLYWPTDLKNTKWSYTNQIGLKLNQRLQNNCQIAQQKWSNFMKSKRDNSHLPSTSPLPSSNKEIEIQKYADKNEQ